MESAFSSLHDFMLHTKSAAYLMIGGGLVILAAFWFFLTGREEKIRRF